MLSGVDWAIDTGVTGLLGPNGAGKTTLLNLLVGLESPASGGVRFQGSSSGTIGFVPQRFSLVGGMRVVDTVAYAAWVNGVDRRGCADAAFRALAAVRLDDLADARVRTLSGGQRQRLGVAAALAHDPDLLVLDEPTVGLDPAQRMRLREVIADIGRTRTVLLSTHLIEDISHLCQRVGVLAEGRLAFDGTEAELTELVDSTPSSGVLGSPFERAYHALVAKLGADRD
ncbi:ATP-binding cassette domain-containing protein [Saccharothrix sp. NRRL B-16314]|uniref:ATP-binding cassette domain-containing protein n=1 Tax=Saccharothrix sp. NRRL B-16314 TaxID=1463825 RepID=UPI001E38125B|nr:ATP-binding cassette domain-containing protein [Saccharothrix sp. NRRL B-16314]